MATKEELEDQLAQANTATADAEGRAETAEAELEISNRVGPRAKEIQVEVDAREAQRRADVEVHEAEKREHRCRRKIMCVTSNGRQIEPYMDELEPGEKPVKMVRINQCYDPNCPKDNNGESGLPAPDTTVVSRVAIPMGRSMTEGARLS
ncbi:MAG: hypothetical protein V3S43_03475 [Acidimicrobiia bacterium]